MIWEEENLFFFRWFWTPTIFAKSKSKFLFFHFSNAKNLKLVEFDYDYKDKRKPIKGRHISVGGFSSSEYIIFGIHNELSPPLQLCYLQPTIVLLFIAIKMCTYSISIFLPERRMIPKCKTRENIQNVFKVGFYELKKQGFLALP